MKTINITLEYDPDTDSSEAHEFECYATMNGRHYHDCLESIRSILMKYDKSAKGKAMSEETKEAIADLRTQCAPHFGGLYHDKK